MKDYTKKEILKALNELAEDTVWEWARGTARELTTVKEAVQETTNAEDAWRAAIEGIAQLPLVDPSDIEHEIVIIREQEEYLQEHGYSPGPG